ncbi:MAG: ImmA/IrrE family metallo-endopeptidase [Rhodoplanes sp.]|jgi:Zn-dependent peptidase ImmA (M78 family)
MIDASPSLRAAEEINVTELASYLVANGWTVMPSRNESISVFSKNIEGTDEPITIVLPKKEGFADDHRRVADALRTLAQMESQSEMAVAQSIRGDYKRNIVDDASSLAELFSDAAIEEVASAFRKALGLSDKNIFNIVELLETEVPKKLSDFRLEIFSEKVRENIKAYSQITPPRIFVRDDIYLLARSDDPRSRSLLAHELGHFLILQWQSHSDFFGDRDHMFRSRESAEAQASKFALAFLMPSSAVSGFENPGSIAQHFKVNVDDARERMFALKRFLALRS